MNALILLTGLVAMIPFCTQAAPMNMTEKGFSYCKMNDTLIRVTVTELYNTTSDALDALDKACNKTGLVR